MTKMLANLEHDWNGLGRDSHMTDTLRGSAGSSLYPRESHLASFLNTEQMSLQEVVLPSKDTLSAAVSSCKLDLTLGGSSGSKQSADILGSNISKASKCSMSASDAVLHQMFGKRLEASKGGFLSSRPTGADEDAGVAVDGQLKAPLGSSYRESLQGAQDACQDYGTMLLHRLSHKPAKLDAKDASKMLRSFGRCMQGMGEATEFAACQIGNLKEAGGDSGKLCKEVQRGGDNQACTIS